MGFNISLTAIYLIMSKAASLPPWDLIPPWEKRVQPAAAPVVQKVRFAHLENTFIPPLPPPPPPPPEPVTSAPAQTPSNAHRRAILLPKNPRPVRPRLPSSPRPTEQSSESTNDSSPTKAAHPLPPPPPVPEPTQVRTRSRSSTLPGALESPPSSASRPPLPLNTSYPTPPSSTKSPISPQKALEGNAFSTSKTLPPPPPLPPQPDVAHTDNTTYKNPAPARKSRFNVLKRSLSLKILPQSSNGRRSPSTISATVTPQSPTLPTPDIAPNWANTIVPSNSLRRKTSKQLTSLAYNGEVFTRIETEGSRVVSIGEGEKEISEYLARSPRTAKALTGSLPATKAPKSLHVRQRSRRLASPGYVQEKYSLAEGGTRSRDITGDAVVSGGRSPGISGEEMRANRNTELPRNEPKAIPTRPQRPERPDRPDTSTFDILDLYDQEMATPSPKPEPPPKESSAGPRLIPLKYAAAASPKETAPVGPVPPKFIPLEFLSPPSPEESEDDSFPYAYERIDDDPPIEIVPLRIKSSENTPTSGRNIKITSPGPSNDSESTAQAWNNELESTARETNTDFESTTRETSNESATRAPSCLTAHLVRRVAPRKLYSATHSTFLRCCSDGRINIPTLSRYLTQERIFLHNCLRFLALLIANVSITSRPAPRSSSPSQPSTKADGQINARLTPHLITCLSHVQARLSLFLNLSNDVPEFNLESWEETTEDGMTDATRMLARLFDVIGTAVEKGDKSVLVGVVVLWVREKVQFPSHNITSFIC